MLTIKYTSPLIFTHIGVYSRGYIYVYIHLAVNCNKKYVQMSDIGM